MAVKKAFRARLGILCARYLFSVIESTPSPWDSGSWIESHGLRSDSIRLPESHGLGVDSITENR